jgi:hypothetical protein
MESNRYEIFRGREVGGRLLGLRICGYAFQNERESHYRVRLFFLSDNTYYMSKNQGPGYTIFAKCSVDESGKATFQNPVGFARLMDHVKTHLYVRFPDLAAHMFMSLYPSERAESAPVADSAVAA